MANSTPKINVIYTKLNKLKNDVNQALIEKDLEEIQKLNEIPEIIRNLEKEKQDSKEYLKFFKNENYELIDEEGLIDNIKSYQFYNDIYLQKVYLAYNFSKSTQFGAASFSGTKIKEVDLPNAIKIDSHQCFSGCKYLKNFNANNLESIGYSFFNNCTSMEKIYLPSLEGLQGQVFSNCINLQSIIIPKAIILENSTGCFYQCDNLNYIKLNPYNKCSKDPFEGVNKNNSIILDCSDASSNKSFQFINSKFITIKKIIFKNEEEKKKFKNYYQNETNYSQEIKDSVLAKICTKAEYNAGYSENNPLGKTELEPKLFEKQEVTE